MRGAPRKTPRRQSEAAKFQSVLLRLRDELGWTQPQFATRLNISRRTLSHWESGHWLPPFKQRLHVVLALRDMPPQYVLEAADGLGVSADPAVEPFLRPYREALAEENEDDAQAAIAPQAPAPPPPPPPPDAQTLRAVVDPIVRDAADAMNVAANDLRAAIGRVLAASAAIAGTLEGVQEAVAVKTPRRAAAPGPAGSDAK